jgi:pimeloyl-ACP methyl ester carboxylesterase
MQKLPVEKLPGEIATLAAQAEIHWLPCGQGRLPIRRWSNEGAEKVVLLHGGSGSWLHWVKNLESLRRQFDVYAVDLPGLGDADMCTVESDADSAADETCAALQELIKTRFHIVAFSWGCTITAMMMRALSDRLKSVMLTGPAAVGDLPRRQQMKPLIKRTSEMSRQQVLAAHEENLGRLMIHRPECIDELAIMIQDVNTSKARFSSPQYARSKLLIDGVAGTETPLYVIYGDHDAPAFPELEARRLVFEAVRPDVQFELVEGAGHWLQYEQAGLFNERCSRWLNQHAETQA